jgi:hypothetical protein
MLDVVAMGPTAAIYVTTAGRTQRRGQAGRDFAAEHRGRLQESEGGLS